MEGLTRLTIPGAHRSKRASLRLSVGMWRLPTSLVVVYVDGHVEGSASGPPVTPYNVKVA